MKVTKLKYEGNQGFKKSSKYIPYSRLSSFILCAGDPIYSKD